MQTMTLQERMRNVADYPDGTPMDAETSRIIREAAAVLDAHEQVVRYVTTSDRVASAIVVLDKLGRSDVAQSLRIYQSELRARTQDVEPAALDAKGARIAELEGLVSELAYRATPLRELVAKARALTPTPKARETEGEVRK